MSVLQSKMGTGAQNAAVTITLDSPTTAGSGLLVFGVGCALNTNPHIGSITLGGSADNWTSQSSTGGNSNHSFVNFWSDLNCASGQTSVVITPASGAGAGSVLYWVFECNDLPLSGTIIDKSATFDSSGFVNSWTIGATAATTQANERIFAIGGGNSSSTTVSTFTGPSSPWTNFQQGRYPGSGSNAPSGICGYKDVSSTGTQSYAVSASSPTCTIDGLIVCLKLNASDNGTGAITLQKMTVDGSGYTKIAGTGDISLKKMVVAATATAPLIGSGDIVLQKMTADVSGFSEIAGTGDLTLQKMVVDGSGGPVSSGTADLTLQKMVVDGSGFAKVSITGDLTLQKMVVDASGTVTAAGSGDLLLKKMEVSGTATAPLVGTSDLAVKKMELSGTGSVSGGSSTVYTLFEQPALGLATSNDGTTYTLGMQFELSEDAALTGIWWYSGTDAAALPAKCAIWDVNSETTVSGTEDDSATWSGAAASGWVKREYDGSVTLTAGTKYVVSVGLEGGVNNRYAATGHYWDATGDGASGVTNGIISAPNNALSEHGQDVFNAGDTMSYPSGTFNASNYWIDVEVTTAGSGVSGIADIVLKKMLVSASGFSEIDGTADLTLRKMEAAGTATAPLLGSGDLTLRKMTTDGSGISKIAGSGDISLRKMELSATGTAPVAGTADLVLKKMTVDASGNIKIPGTAGVTLKKMLVSGMATAPLIGTADITLKKMTVFGSAANFGSAALTIQKMSFDASGSVKVAGTSSVSFQKMTVSGTATAPVAGTSNLIVKKMTASAAGFTRNSGSAAITIRKITVSGIGSAGGVGFKSSPMFIFSPL